MKNQFEKNTENPLLMAMIMKHMATAQECLTRWKELKITLNIAICNHDHLETATVLHLKMVLRYFFVHIETDSSG